MGCRFVIKILTTQSDQVWSQKLYDQTGWTKRIDRTCMGAIVEMWVQVFGLNFGRAQFSRGHWRSEPNLSRNSYYNIAKNRAIFFSSFLWFFCLSMLQCPTMWTHAHTWCLVGHSTIFNERSISLVYRKKGWALVPWFICKIFETEMATTWRGLLAANKQSNFDSKTVSCGVCRSTVPVFFYVLEPAFIISDSSE